MRPVIVKLVSDLLLRPATADDLAAVAVIYNEGIEDRLATFETRPRSATDVRAWLDDGLPFLVAAAGDGVYVARAARGEGLGRRLLEALCDAAEQAGLYKLTSRVFTDNAASRRAHVAAGFHEVGVQRRHGRLDGRWKDCVLVERLLGEAAAA